MHFERKDFSLGLGTAVMVLVLISKTDAHIKMTNVECHSMNETTAKVAYCRLKAVRRDVVEFSSKVVLTQKIKTCWVNIEVLRKYNTYKPYIFNYTYEMCSFLKNSQKMPAMSIVYNLFKDYSNMNHTCPYEGELIIEKFYPDDTNIPLPVPGGDYLFKSSWIAGNTFRVDVKIWFTLRERETWKLPKLDKKGVKTFVTVT